MAGEYGSGVNLPPGFRFSPTDEELILHFLLPKARHMRCYPDIIPDLGYSMPHPWQLHGKALWSENRYYFFRRVMKDDDETEINSSSSTAGIWKEEEEEEEEDDEAIFSSSSGAGDMMHVIGLKKLLVYFCSTEPDDHETNWFMQQYYLHHHHQYNLDYCKWTLCIVEERKGRLDQRLSYDDEASQLSCLDEMYLELDDDEYSDVTFPT